MFVVIVIVIMVVMMFVFVFLIVIIIFKGREPDRFAVFDDFENEIRLHIVPGGGDDPGVRMGLGDQLAALFNAVGREELGTAEDDGGGALDLIEEEFAEILHIHTTLSGVHDGGAAADLDFGMAGFRLFHSGENFAELADACGLHKDTIRMVGVDQLVHGSLEIAGEGAADAAGVQLGDGDAGVLHEAAVDADFAVFVLQQDHLFIAEAAGEELFDEGCFSGSKETGDDVDFYHSFFLLSKDLVRFASALRAAGGDFSLLPTDCRPSLYNANY